MPKSVLGKWSAGFVAAVVLLYVLVPIFEYRVGNAGPGSTTRAVLAIVMAIASAGSIVTGVTGLIKKRPVYIIPLAAGVIGLIGSAGFGFNVG